MFRGNMVGYVGWQSSPNKLFHLNFVDIPMTGTFLVVHQLTSGFKILNSLSAFLMEIIESGSVELIHLLLGSCSGVNVGKKKESRGSLPDLHLHIADNNIQEQESIQTVRCISTWQHVILWIYKTKKFSKFNLSACVRRSNFRYKDLFLKQISCNGHLHFSPSV